MARAEYDAVIVGAGPNGLAAAVALAQEQRRVLVLEANDEVGGAARSAELTLPGFVHDPFSGVYPLGIGSPFFQTLPLHEHGLEWVQPDAPLAHPFDDGSAALLQRSVAETAAQFTARDARAYRRIFEPLVRDWPLLVRDILAPLGLPRHPLVLARFGLSAIQSAEGWAKRNFGTDAPRALFAGSAAHTGLPLGRAATAAFGLVLNVAGHAVGWPIARGGAGAITQALASYLRSLGGEIVTGQRVASLDELPAATSVLLNLTPRQILRVCDDRLPESYRSQLQEFEYGAGVFKVDWALSAPIPWAAEACARAGTVHLGGGLDELVASEECPRNGRIAERPFILLSQPSLFDEARAPAGQHTAWAYCHVPNGSTVDMTERIEAQVERFAPGFRETILARHVLAPADLERLDANLVGGDVNGGAPDLGQLFFRPALRRDPYATPVPGLFICSASTPPGGAVHGMCGWHASRSALRWLERS